MNDLIELYRPFLLILKQKQINKKLKEIPSFKLRQLQEDYQSNIHLLFKYGNYDSKYTYPDLKKDFFYEYSINEITLKLMKRIKYGDGEYAINEYNKTAGVVGFNTDERSVFYVPNEIEYGSEKVQAREMFILNFNEILHSNILEKNPWIIQILKWSQFHQVLNELKKDFALTEVTFNFKY